MLYVLLIFRDYVEICNSSVDGFTQHVSYFCCTIDWYLCFRYWCLSQMYYYYYYYCNDCDLLEFYEQRFYGWEWIDVIYNFNWLVILSLLPKNQYTNSKTRRKYSIQNLSLQDLILRTWMSISTKKPLSVKFCQSRCWVDIYILAQLWEIGITTNLLNQHN